MTSDACYECTATVDRGGMWHVYRESCDECSARAISRSLAAFRAVRHHDVGALREMIARMLPTRTYAEARAMVWRWWIIDHPTSETELAQQEKPTA